MTVPTRKEWEKIRNDAGGEPAEAKVNIGESLDAYHKALAREGATGSVRPLEILEKDLKTYVDVVKKAKPKLAAAVQTKVLAQVQATQKQLQAIASLPSKIGALVTAIRKTMASAQWSRDRAKVAELIGAVRAAADRLIAVDPSDRWAQVHRMATLALQALGAFDKVAGGNGAEVQKLMLHAASSVEDALAAIEKRLG